MQYLQKAGHMANECPDKKVASAYQLVKPNYKPVTEKPRKIFTASQTVKNKARIGTLEIKEEQDILKQICNRQKDIVGLCDHMQWYRCNHTFEPLHY